MSNKENSGREPSFYIQLEQDFCSRTFGSAPCRAGKSNLIVDSAGFDDSSSGDWLDFDSQQSYTPATGQNSGDYQTIQATSNGIIMEIRTDTNLPSGTESVWISFEAKEGTGVDVVEFQMKGSSTVGGSILSAECRLYSTAAKVVFNGTDYLDFEVTDLGSGWQRFQLEVNAPLIDSPTYARFVFKSQSSTFVDSGDNIQFGNPMITFQKDQDYLATTGAPISFPETRPCFNTRATCTDPDNFNASDLDLKFCSPRNRQFTNGYYIPMVDSYSLSPAELNFGGSNRNKTALGKRAVLSVTFKDSIHNDKLVDPYTAQRNYDPLERGTFWTKWRARNPYYVNRVITLYSGYVENGALADFALRKFLITDFQGPDPNGRVTITAKDPLHLLDSEKAQAPIASTGKLDADINSVVTSLTLTPSGVGALEYPASGKIRVNDEVMAFTRSGDVLTLTRGQVGTTATDHDAGDTAQLCLEYTSDAPRTIIQDLLQDYANVPASFLNTFQWLLESNAYLPRLYSALITEPTAVSTLVSEICEQMYLTLWYDERTGKINLRALRPASAEEVRPLDQDSHLVADSVVWKDLDDERITQVWVYYGRIDPTKNLDEVSNYAAIEVLGEFENELPERYDGARIKKIFSRWIDAGNAAAAVDLGNKILSLYANAPRQCEFSLDAKDGDLWLSDFVRITHRNNVDFYGEPTGATLQIRRAAEAEQGTRFAYKAIEYVPRQVNDEVNDPTKRNVILATDLLNVNLRTLHDSQYGTPQSGDEVTFTIRSGVIIGGDAAGGGENVPLAARDASNDVYDAGNSSVSGKPIGLVPILQRSGLGSMRETLGGASYDGGANARWKVVEYPKSIALQTGTWPSGVVLRLVVQDGAMILGEGGNGGAHALETQLAVNDPAGRSYFCESIDAGDGGDALKIDYDISIANNGVIAGGGGGGSAAISDIQFEYDSNGGAFTATKGLAAGGGGGAGSIISSTKASFLRAEVEDRWVVAERQAGQGAVDARGVGGILEYFTFVNVNTISALPINSVQVRCNTADSSGLGAGGNLANNGQGANGSIIYELNGSVADEISINAAGSAGAAVASGANDIAWEIEGDIRGAQNG